MSYVAYLITVIHVKSYQYPTITADDNILYTLHPLSEVEPLEKASLLLLEDAKVMLIHDSKNIVYAVNNINLVPNL
jgi:hypothetical protein